MYLGYNAQDQIKYYTQEIVNEPTIVKWEETDDEYVLSDDLTEYVPKDEAWEAEQSAKRQREFYSNFLETSLGNYRLQPKGYANAQQSIDTVNNIVMAFGGLTEQVAQMVIFYETPDFSKEEECTEEWLINHQYNPEPMAREQWLQFYVDFTTRYATHQYRVENA